VTRPVALVPGVRALLPRYASLEDPVAELRAACLSAVDTLGPRVRVLAADDGAAEVAAALVAAAGADVVVVEEEPSGVLVVGNGSAKRTEKAPGYLDERAERFDDELRAGLLAGTPAPDPALAAELWADVGVLDRLSGLVTGAPEVLYDAAPFGVQYWVMTWA
jgi:hypothetical protein